VIQLGHSEIKKMEVKMEVEVGVRMKVEVGMRMCN
jgi:hypothetical protein